ncbi:4Fe-4S binding protein [Desulfitobacterium sp. PCE1]|uniref:4Fe-4S binding protein n=1 Tax=Desulfitobacterium sp. PCE1 TaxID=146907 RepID=UPI0003763E41
MLKISWNRCRRIVQVSMILIFLLPLMGIYQVIGTLSSSRILGLTLTDPFAFLEILLASKAVTITFLMSALLIVGIYLFLGKVFCSWICPIGFLIEGVDALKKKWKWLTRIQLKKAVTHEQKQYYWALPFFLVLSLVVGIPIFQTLSPLGILYRTFLFGLGLEAFLILMIILLELAGYRRGWCRTLCPIGVFYALGSRWSPIKVRCDTDKCVQCFKCVKACNYTAESLKSTITSTSEFCVSSLCTRCGRCIDSCSSGALQFSLQPVADLLSEEGGEKISRRSVLQGAGMIALAGLAYKPSQALAAAAPRVFRPPGAVRDEEFLAKCLRCGKCIEVCPDKTLLSAHLDQGLNLGTPYFIPRRVPCSLCMECPDVCPSGALVPLGMREVKIGIAEIDKNRCYAYQDDVCRSCYNSCPLIDEAIKMEGFQYPVVDPEICTGCGICEYVCVMEYPAIQIKRMM